MPVAMEPPIVSLSCYRSNEMRSEGKGPDDPNDSKMLEVLKNMFKIPEGD